MSTSNLQIQKEQELFDPNFVVPMYVIDAGRLGGDILRFCNYTLPDGNDVLWQANTYARWPMTVDGFEFSSAGQLPRLKVTFSNVFGTFTAFNRGFADLTRALFIRKRAFFKHLDGQAAENPNIHYPDDIFTFSRKIIENKNIVQYEMTSELEIDNLALPGRQVYANLCVWKYRSSECSYSGLPVANRYGAITPILPTTDRGEWTSIGVYDEGHYVNIPLDGERLHFYIAREDGITGDLKRPPNDEFWFDDDCSKRVSDGCKYRHGPEAIHDPTENPLPYGGFPGAARLDTGS